MRPTLSGTTHPGSRGYSIVELVVSMSLLVVLSAIAIPTMTTSIRSYQLNDGAIRLSDNLKFTRFEAVRKNKPINMLIQWNGTSWVTGTDSNGNTTIDPSEKQVVFSGFATLLPLGGMPSTGAITTALGVSGLTVLSGSAGQVTFDARGALQVGGNPPSTVYVFCISDSVPSQFGYRAVVLLPGGATQIWAASVGGAWTQIN